MIFTAYRCAVRNPTSVLVVHRSLKTTNSFCTLEYNQNLEKTVQSLTGCKQQNSLFRGFNIVDDGFHDSRCQTSNLQQTTSAVNAAAIIQRRNSHISTPVTFKQSQKPMCCRAVLSCTAPVQGMHTSLTLLDALPQLLRPTYVLTYRDLLKGTVHSLTESKLQPAEKTVHILLGQLTKQAQRTEQSMINLSVVWEMS